MLRTRAITITTDHTVLQGDLSLPEKPVGLVLFAHGSGSSRFSPRNRFVAKTLQLGELATVLLDLLDDRESTDRRKVFDIELLAGRLLAASDWLSHDEETASLLLGYFGASTGAGAALQAAALEPQAVAAVVSRGGRPDLADAYLPRVVAPTLLIVGGHDEPVIGMNEAALARLTCPKRIVVIPGATHLFEEPGTLEQVAGLALDWFRRYLPAGDMQ